jgi:alpha-maltose-1-phosphate synthase
MTPPLHIGIVARSDNTAALDMANALADIGTRVSLYLCKDHFSREAGIDYLSEDNLYKLGILSTGCVLRLIHYPRMRDLRSMLVIHRLSQTIRGDGVNIVHLMVGPGEIWLSVLAILLRKIPVVSTMVIPVPNVGDTLPKSISITGYRLLAAGSDVIIVNGQDQVNQVKKIYRFPESRLFYVPLCPRLTSVKWSRDTYEEKPDTILFFGRADPHKGLEYLIQAQPLITNIVPGARFIIVAHGDYLKQCLNLIEDDRKFEIHDEFVNNDQASMFFQKSSLVVLPYLSASTSGVLLTAYGFGKPVVITQVGSLPEYVQDGITGLIVPPADKVQLAAAISRLLKDDTLRHRMGLEAKSWLSQRQSDVAHQTLQAYQKAVSRHRLND